MRGFLAGLLVLGLAGFDPLTGLLAIAALAGGATRRGILLFAVTCLLVPLLMGTALSLSLGATRLSISLSSVDWDSPWLALSQAVIAVVLLVWAARRARSARSAHPRGPRGTSVRSLFALALVVGGGFILDPVFLAVVVFVGRTTVWQIIVAHLTWSLMSQSLLVAMAIAVATGRDKPATRVLNRLVVRFGPALRIALTSLIALAGIVMGADVATYLITGGEYLLH